MSFSGKVVLITGASSGIGSGAALHLASLGAKVSMVGRNKDRLNKMVEEIKSAGSPIPLSIVADVTKDADRIVNETIKHFGKLDVLVNNAGIAIKDNIIEVSISEFDRIFDTNVRSIITLTKLCVPHLEKTKGNVVNISSLTGLVALPNMMSYCISKSSLDQFTKCCALGLAPKGIRCNSINPAVIRTPIIETFGITGEQADEMWKEFAKDYPIGRPGEVNDTSAAIAFLADNEKASYLTGVLLPVDGGSMVAGTFTL